MNDQSKTDFLKKVYTEKNMYIQHRHEFIKQKLLLIVGLFSIGNVPIEKVNLSIFLYLVIFVALAYDVYILSEDFKIKRVGKFIREHYGVETMDNEWEHWLNSESINREKMALIASAVLTLLTFIGSAYILIPRTAGDPMFLYLIWFSASLILGLTVFIVALVRRYLMLKTRAGPNTPSSND